MAPLRSTARAAGFTLLEVMVALAIGSVAIAAAAASLRGLSTQARRLHERAEFMDRAAGQERLLETLLANTRAGPEGVGLEGDAASLAFASWCDAPGGALQPCRVRVELHRSSAQLDLRAGDGPGEEVTRLDLSFDEDARFAYLVDAAYGGTWTEAWSELREAPRAVGLVVGSDTILFPVGAP